MAKKKKDTCIAWRRTFSAKKRGAKSRKSGYVEVFQSRGGWSGEGSVAGKRFHYRKQNISVHQIKGPSGIAYSVEQSKKVVPGTVKWDGGWKKKGGWKKEGWWTEVDWNMWDQRRNRKI